MDIPRTPYGHSNGIKWVAHALYSMYISCIVPSVLNMPYVSRPETLHLVREIACLVFPKAGRSSLTSLRAG